MRRGIIAQAKREKAMLIRRRIVRRFNLYQFIVIGSLQRRVCR